MDPVLQGQIWLVQPVKNQKKLSGRVSSRYFIQFLSLRRSSDAFHRFEVALRLAGCRQHSSLDQIEFVFRYHYSSLGVEHLQHVIALWYLDLNSLALFGPGMNRFIIHQYGEKSRFGIIDKAHRNQFIPLSELKLLELFSGNYP